MFNTPAILITKKALARDAALKSGGRGVRKLLVTSLIASKERLAQVVEWAAPEEDEKCPVQIMDNAEVSVFNQYARQDCHFHKNGTELYMVIEGEMGIEVEEQLYVLRQGDMIVVNPTAKHEVKHQTSDFLCRVVTINCGGHSDKFIA